jgi:hypothetical protein
MSSIISPLDSTVVVNYITVTERGTPQNGPEESVMNLRMERQSRMRAISDDATGRILLALILVMAGIGAAATPLLADLMSAVAGALIISLVFAAWTTLRPGRHRVGTKNLLKAV